MHTNTIRAIQALASDHYVITEMGDDTVIIRSAASDLLAEGELGHYETRRVSGGWILARYSDRHCQWQSSDVRSAEQGFCYAFSRTLQGLADYGVTTYRNPSAALRAAMEA